MTFTLIFTDLDYDTLNDVCWLVFDEPAEWSGDMTSYNLEIEITDDANFQQLCKELDNAGIEYNTQHKG
jgi:hypothetical protein